MAGPEFIFVSKITEERPWGSFTVLDEGVGESEFGLQPTRRKGVDLSETDKTTPVEKIYEFIRKSFKIKRITVNPKQSLSLQYHLHRDEHWICVEGLASVLIDGEETLLSVGKSIDIKKEQRHRLSNPTDKTTQIIEIQLGDYLEEDDIVRLEDIYGRVKK
jgi:mannose-6-phosphate isomerase-like protein (cupin superfamily)